VAPWSGDCEGADGSLEDQVQADDPRHELAKGRVRVSVGASGLRNHRRELRVAESGEGAGAAEENEREHQGRTGSGTDDLAMWPNLSRGRSSDRAEDTGADNGADGQHDQVARAQRPSESLGAF